ncbi:MAG: alpha/beta hydrolase [Clostridiales bacterium]|nr:alpha/beta hydrolase [Clostridiales bacterium]
MGKNKKRSKQADILEEPIRAETNKLIDQINNDKELNGWQKHRRRRAVKKTKALFRAIDILFSMPQNSCPYVKKSNEDKIECQADIVYDGGESDICTFDMYRIPTNEPQPAVIIIHGGGFTAGDKKYRKGRAKFLALNGFTVFCINYGLAPDFTFPSPILHIVDAANYIHAHAEKFNIDASRIILDGDSAGAYYAALVASLNNNEKLKTRISRSLDFKAFGVLLNCGIYDMATVRKVRDPLDIADGVILSLTGAKIDEFNDYEYSDCCMPIDFVNSDFPPTFLIYSSADIFCRGQGDVLKEKLDSCGVYYEYYNARHITSNHCFSLTWSGEDAVAANELMLSFAKRLAGDKIKFK